MNRFLAFCLFCNLLFSCAATKVVTTPLTKDLSPYEFGLSEAKTGEDRYRVIYKTHVAAIKAGVNVSYKGISSIELEIPHDAKEIPLTSYSDFNGVVFNVKNYTDKQLFLFILSRKSTEIAIQKKDIDKGSFKNYPEFKTGRHLLVVSDEKPWVENREGYNYGHVRKDILLIEKGKSVNETIMPYNNAASSPTCQYYSVGVDSTILSNITLVRSIESKSKVYLCHFKGVDNLVLRNINIYTPQNDWTGDVAISIKECTNVFFDGVTIDGTYSRKNYSGYGVQMNTIWNFHVRNMKGNANWGIFGTNNINLTRFENCDINRFDIHCYGRNVSFDNVVFRDKYNQFSSVYGTISFNGCTFIDFVPIVNGSSYNSYVGYDVIMNDCKYIRESGIAMLIDEGYIDDKVNERKELQQRCLPNVVINNLSLQVGPKVQEVYLFYFRHRFHYRRRIDNLSTITINGLKVDYVGNENRTPINFEITNLSVSVNSPVRQTFNHIDIIGNSTKASKSNGRMTNRLEMLSPRSSIRTSDIRVTSFE